MKENQYSLLKSLLHSLVRDGLAVKIGTSSGGMSGQWRDTFLLPDGGMIVLYAGATDLGVWTTSFSGYVDKGVARAVFNLSEAQAKHSLIRKVINRKVGGAKRRWRRFEGLRVEDRVIQKVSFEETGPCFIWKYDRPGVTGSAVFGCGFSMEQIKNLLQ